MKSFLPAAISIAIGFAALASAPFVSGVSGAPRQSGPPLSEAPAVPPPAVAPDRIVVRLKDGVPPQFADALIRSQGVRTERDHRRSRLRLIDTSGKDVATVLAALRRSPIVAEAGVSRTVRALEVPNDTYYPYQWHLQNTTGGLRAEAAWDIAPARGSGAVVAVIDTGVAYEDFSGPGGLGTQTFKRAPDLATTSFVAPWDFVNNDAHANDDNGHGTHVAGTIAQSTGNAYGVAGVARNATIMPVKILTYDGTGADADLVEAIYYAVDNGADIISMSLGFSGSGAPDGNGNVCTEIIGLNAALDYAEAHGVFVTAAAGNDGGIVTCPAAYPSVVAVGATRFDGGAPSYSNRGAALDVAAPGGDTTVDQNGDGWSDGVLQETYCDNYFILLLSGKYDTFCDVFYQGTSMATPHVAGTAALLIGESPALTPAQVRQILESTARDRGAPGRDDIYGWGAVDAAAAVAALGGVSPSPTPGGPTLTPSPSPTPTSTRTATPTSTPTASLTPTNTPTVTPTPTASPTPLPAMHIGDLDGEVLGSGAWNAKATVYVHTVAHAPVDSAFVAFAYSGGSSGQTSCVTNAAGSCYVLASQAPASASTVTFTVTNVTRSGFAYMAGANHDPESDSNGTVLVVTNNQAPTSTPTPSATPTSSGPTSTPTATRTATSTPTATATRTPTVTATPTPTRTPTPVPGPMHSGDLDGAVLGNGAWNAKVTVSVHDASHSSVSGVFVAFAYSGGANGETSCVTDGSGRCYVLASQAKPSATSVTFTVFNMTKSGFSYTPSANHDPDGDSNGTTIVVTKP